MYQIRVASVDNPKVYRVFKVFPDQTLFDFEDVLDAGFDELGELDSAYEAKCKNGQPANDMIFSFPEDEQDFDSDEELLSEWLVQPGDVLVYYVEEQAMLTIELEKIVNELLQFEVCVEGKGTLHAPRKTIDLDEINMELSLKQAMQDLDLLDFDNMLEPDYETLLQLSNTLNKMKPWRYLASAEIIALELAGYEETFFVSVVGAGGEDFGLMIYEQEYGYSLLEAALLAAPLDEDAHINLSGFAVNFVDRTELEKEDYQLIKDCDMTFRGKNNWIQFRTYHPGTIPVNPSYIDVEMLKEIVQAMIQLTEECMQGWEYPAVPLHTYPAFEVFEGDIMKEYILEVPRLSKGTVEIELTDIERGHYKRKPKAALQLEFDIFYMPYAIESEEAPGIFIYPAACVVFDCTTGEAIYHDVLPLPKFDFMQQQMFWQLLKEIPVRPSKVYVSRGAKEVLGQLAKLLGIELVASELPNARKFKELVASNPLMEF